MKASIFLGYYSMPENNIISFGPRVIPYFLSRYWVILLELVPVVFIEIKLAMDSSDIGEVFFFTFLYLIVFTFIIFRDF